MSRFKTIDISALFSELGTNLENKMHVAKQINESCRDTGFFFISNHSVDCLNELFKRVQQFHFALEEKEKIEMAVKAYNKKNNTEMSGYFMAIKGVKAPESLVCIT